MRGVKVAIALLVIGLIGTGAVLWWMLQHGFSARDQPAAVEIWIARRLRHLAIRSRTAIYGKSYPTFTGNFT